jgi:hypothetical protein
MRLVFIFPSKFRKIEIQFRSPSVAMLYSFRLFDSPATDLSARNLRSLRRPFALMAHYHRQPGNNPKRVLCPVRTIHSEPNWLDRTEKSYLWLGLECSTILLYSYTLVSMETSERLSQTSAHQILAVAGAVVPVFWILFFAVWFRLDRINKLHRIVWPLALLDYLCSATALLPLYSWMVHFGVPGWMLSLNQFSDSPLVVVLL